MGFRETARSTGNREVPNVICASSKDSVISIIKYGAVWKAGSKALKVMSEQTMYHYRVLHTILEIHSTGLQDLGEESIWAERQFVLTSPKKFEDPILSVGVDSDSGVESPISKKKQNKH